MRTDAALSFTPMPADTALDRERAIRRRREYLKNAAVYALLTVLAIIFMLPIFWMASTSLKLPAEVFAFPMQWVPGEPQWGNYAEAFSKYPLGRFLLNSTFLTAVSIAGQLISVPIMPTALRASNFRGSPSCSC